MFELIVIACLMSEPATCDRFPVPFQEPMGMMECLRESQIQIASWAAEHPNWRVRRWICEMPEA